MKGAPSFRLILVIHTLSFLIFFPLYDIVHSNTYLFVIYISFQELTTFMLIQVFKSTGVEELMFLVSQLKTKLHPQVNPSYHTGCNYNNFTSSLNFLPQHHLVTDLQLDVARRLGRDGGEGDLNSASDQVLDGCEINVNRVG